MKSSSLILPGRSHCTFVGFKNTKNSYIKLGVLASLQRTFECLVIDFLTLSWIALLESKSRGRRKSGKNFMSTYKWYRKSKLWILYNIYFCVNQYEKWENDQIGFHPSIFYFRSLSFFKLSLQNKYIMKTDICNETH